MNPRILYKGLFFIGVLLLNEIAWPSSLNIAPMDLSVLPTSILKGQTATAYYKVQNNTTVVQKNNQVHLPPNVVQVVSDGINTNTCGVTFDLAATGTSPVNPNDLYSWCILQLTITGAVDSNDADPTHHLAVCQDNLNCSSVSNKENELNIIEGRANELARVAIVDELTDPPSIDNKLIALTSTDSGISWKRNAIGGLKGIIYAVKCDESGQSCTAVGGAFRPAGGIETFLAFNSRDGGLNWASHVIDKHTGVSGGIVDVVCDSENGQYCVAIGGYSTPNSSIAPIVYTSSDSGNHWIPHYPKTFGIYGTTLRSVSCSGSNEQYCIAVGDFSENKITTFLAYTSIDGGINWTPNVIGKFQGPSGSVLKGVVCNRDNGQNCIAVGHLGGDAFIAKQPIIYKSNNAGVDWSPYIPEQKTGGMINAIVCGQNNGQYCLAVGSIGSNRYPFVYKSIDQGETWVTHKLSINSGRNKNGATYTSKGATLTSLTCSKNGEYCTIVGYSIYHFSQFNGKSNIDVVLPVIFRSIDNGASWHQRSPDFANQSEFMQNINTAGISIAGNTH